MASQPDDRDALAAAWDGLPANAVHTQRGPDGDPDAAAQARSGAAGEQYARPHHADAWQQPDRSPEPAAPAGPEHQPHIGGRDLLWPEQPPAAQGVGGSFPTASPGVSAKPIRGYRPTKRRVSRRAIFIGAAIMFAMIVGLLAVGLFGMADDQPESEAREDTVASEPAAEQSGSSPAEDGYEVVERDDDSVELRFSADVLFELGESDLTDSARASLDKIVSRIEDEAAGTITVEGHTDSAASEQFNLELSEARARAVSEYLTSAGVALAIEAHGHGESRPVVPNDNADGTPNEDGRARNRRVTIAYDR